MKRILLASLLLLVFAMPAAAVAQDPFGDQLAANAAADEPPGQTGDEGHTLQILENADDLIRGGAELARRIQQLSLILCAMMIGLGVVMANLGSFTGRDIRPVAIAAYGLGGAIGILVYPQLMDFTKEICDSTAYFIDTFQFRIQQDGAVSSAVAVFEEMEASIGAAFEKAEFWTLLTSSFSALLMYLAWFLMILFYEGYRFIWQVGWIALLVTGPFAMAAAATGTQAGTRIARGWVMSVLNLAVWPIAISILFALLRLGLGNFGADPGSIGLKQALVAFIVAFMIPVVLGLTKTFLHGGGLDTNIAAFANQMSTIATLGALKVAGTAMSHVPVVGGAFGRIASGAGEMMSAQDRQERDATVSADRSARASQVAGNHDKRQVSPMPSGAEPDRAVERTPREGSTPPGMQSSNGSVATSPGVLARLGDAGKETALATGRTAWSGAKVIANMASVANENQMREMGYARAPHRVETPPPRPKPRPSGPPQDASSIESGPPASGGFAPGPSSPPAGGHGPSGSGAGSHGGPKPGDGGPSPGGVTTPGPGVGPTDGHWTTMGRGGGDSGPEAYGAPQGPGDNGTSAGAGQSLTSGVRTPTLDEMGMGPAFGQRGSAPPAGRDQHTRPAAGSHSSPPADNSRGGRHDYSVLYEEPGGPPGNVTVERRGQSAITPIGEREFRIEQASRDSSPDLADHRSGQAPRSGAASPATVSSTGRHVVVERDTPPTDRHVIENYSGSHDVAPTEHVIIEEETSSGSYSEPDGVVFPEPDRDHSAGPSAPDRTPDRTEGGRSREDVVERLMTTARTKARRSDNASDRVRTGGLPDSAYHS